MKRFPSMVRRLIKWQVLGMGFAGVLLFAWLIHMMLQFGNGEYDKRMSYFANLLAETSSTAAGDRSLLEHRVKLTEREFVIDLMASIENAAHYRATYRIYDRDGNLMYAAGDPIEFPVIKELGVSDRILADGRTWRLILVRSADESTAVIVGESSLTRWQVLWPFLFMIARAQLAIFTICLLVIWLTASRAMRPLRELADCIAKREGGDLSRIDIKLQFNETAPIVAELNALLDRESRRLENERGFLADAAHELRTPLAAVGVQAHLLMSTDDAEVRRNAAERLSFGVQRVSHLLNQLLTIARVDALGTQMLLEKVNVSAIVRDRMAAVMPAARGRGVTLSLEAEQNICVPINYADFVSIVDNLIDNAIRYSHVEGRVQVTLVESRGSVTLAVRDEGPGIHPSERERVFERFYRIPGGKATGTGLGLAIVRKLAQAHRASVAFVEGIDGRGIGIEICVPTH